jgi:hypothetical protein
MKRNKTKKNKTNNKTIKNKNITIAMIIILTILLMTISYQLGTQNGKIKENIKNDKNINLLLNECKTKTGGELYISRTNEGFIQLGCVVLDKKISNGLILK